MRNTFFSALALFAVNTAIQAQTPASAPAIVSTTLRAATPAGRVTSAAVTTDGYFYSDHQINEADLKSKEVSKEIVTPKNGEIYIENSSRGIVVKTWDQQKVKVTTTVYYEGESKLTDEEWLEKVNLSLKTLGTSVKVKSGSVGGGGMYYPYTSGTSGMISSSGGGVAIFNSNGQNVGTKSNLKRIVTVTVPTGSKLDIESKYADVQLPGNIGDVNVDITNGNLEAEDLNKLILRSKYSNVNIGDVKTAEVEFLNGRFSAKNIDDLDIDSKYSTIEMALAKKLVLRSTNDEYEIEEVGEARGRKSYGNFRITKLISSLEVDGTNADVRVRNVSPTVSLIKLDDKYADVRIPLRNTKNYSLDFTGSYSSVYGNFEKKPVAATEEKKQTTSSGSASGTGTVAAGTIAEVPVVSGIRLTQLRTLNAPGGWNEGNGPSKFTAIVGDGKGLKLDIKCQNCTVDFK